MPLVRMSSLERWLGCSGFQTLAADAPRSDKSVNATAYGTALHSLKEGGEPSKLLLPEDVAARGFFALRYTGWEHEVHLAIDLGDMTAHRFATDEEKQAWASSKPLAITGCTDGVRFDIEANEVFVNDLKSSEHPHDLDDPQLMGYTTWAVLWAKQRLGMVGPRVNASILHWPRTGSYRDEYINANGRPCDWYGRDVPLQELRDFLARLREQARLPAALSPGTHCVFCPGATVCPAYRPERKREMNAN